MFHRGAYGLRRYGRANCLVSMRGKLPSDTCAQDFSRLRGFGKSQKIGRIASVITRQCCRCILPMISDYVHICGLSTMGRFSLRFRLDVVFGFFHICDAISGGGTMIS